VTSRISYLATLYEAQGHYEAAEPRYKRAIAIIETTLGPEHPQVATYLANLAGLEIARNRPEVALLLLQRALLIDEHTLDSVFSLASERKRFAFLCSVDYRYELLLNLVMQKLPADPTAVGAAMDAVLCWKGVVLDALARERRALLIATDPAVAQAAKRLQITASRLASLMWAGPGELTIEEYRSQLAALEAEKEQLEEELAGRSDIYAAARHSREVDAERVAKATPPGSALVEYIVLQTADLQANGAEPMWGSYRYLAFVLPAGRQAQPMLIDLGEAEVIDGAERVFRRQMSDAPTLVARMSETDAAQRLRKAAERLYKLAFDPVQAFLGERRVVYIAPDGALNLMPFEVALDGPGRYLIETYQFNYLSSGRDVLAFGSPPIRGAGVIVLADPDYDSQPLDVHELAQRHIGTARASATPLHVAQLSQQQWARLPGTRQEAATLAETLAGEHVQLYLGADASEEIITGVKSPRILHLATHGFFLDYRQNPPWRHQGGEAQELQALNASPASAPETLTFANPLLRSGLVLAGANALRRTLLAANRDDGILTA
jgi:tetratricopeptide (TPR) repeat protein